MYNRPPTKHPGCWLSLLVIPERAHHPPGVLSPPSCSPEHAAWLLVCAGLAAPQPGPSAAAAAVAGQTPPAAPRGFAALLLRRLAFGSSLAAVAVRHWWPAILVLLRIRLRPRQLPPARGQPNLCLQLQLPCHISEAPHSLTTSVWGRW